MKLSKILLLHASNCIMFDTSYCNSKIACLTLDGNWEKPKISIISCIYYLDGNMLLELLYPVATWGIFYLENGPG